MKMEDHRRKVLRQAAAIPLTGLLLTVAALGATQAAAARPGEVPHAAISQPATAPAAVSGAGRGDTKALTLITGDRVEVTTLADGRRTIRTIAGEGRRVGFIEHEVDGKLSVIPADAEPLLAAGRLDPRLFDVTTQLAQHRDASNVIVQYEGAARARAQAGLVASGARVTRELRGIGAAAVQAAPGKLWATLKPSGRTLGAGISKVWLNGMRRPSLDRSVPQIGAPAAWAAGYTGTGVPVAVVDTGIDATHPDLADRVRAARDFTGTGLGDQVGHGTHVASTIAGTAAASSGRYKGVAFGADLIDAKACQPGGCLDSDILAAMDWAAIEQHAKVINLSLGAPDTPGIDPLEQAVDTLSEQTGALFVIAAGNAGPHSKTLDSPGTADSALSVGAVDSADRLADFSSRGPRLGDNAIKPELTAPGVGIVAALATGTHLGPVVDGQYVELSGTSMATPHVAGAAAVLAQQHPDWNGHELKTALIASAKQITGSVFEVGSGRVDLAAGISQQVLPTPAVLSLGVAEWPHADDAPIVRTVAYRNTGSSAVTLDLTASGNGPGGDAPAGMFSVTPARLTVPAGGSAEATVTVTTRDGADGDYSGRIVARVGSDEVATTPVGVTKEVESATLTLDVLDRNGIRPGSEVYATNVDTGDLSTLNVGTAPQPVRLPKGHYDLQTVVVTAEGEEVKTISLVTRPELRLNTTMSVVLDARSARPIGAVTVDATGTQASVRRAALTTASAMVTVGTDIPEVGIEVTPTGQVGYPYRYRQDISLTQPRGTRNAKGYNLYFVREGQIPEPVFRVRDADLGRVTSITHSDGTVTSPTTLSLDTPFGPGDEIGMPMGYDVTGPGKRYDFYTAGNGVTWEPRGRLAEQRTEFGSPLTMLPGDRQEEHWNQGALRPHLFPYVENRQFSGSLWFSSPAAKNHYAFDYADTVSGRTTLTRDGKKVGTSATPDGGFFELPAGRAKYELANEVTRTLDWSKLATKTTSKWRFTMDPAVAGTPLALNLRVLVPAADLTNSLDRLVPNQVSLTPELTGAGATLMGATLAVSYDDGVTWRLVPTRPQGDHFAAVLPPAPLGASYVTLRAGATDAAGDAVEHIITRAYALR